jgi:hypothetical protein
MATNEQQWQQRVEARVEEMQERVAELSADRARLAEAQLVEARKAMAGALLLATALAKTAESLVELLASQQPA